MTLKDALTLCAAASLIGQGCGAHDATLVPLPDAGSPDDAGPDVSAGDAAGSAGMSNSGGSAGEGGKGGGSAGQAGSSGEGGSAGQAGSSGEGGSAGQAGSSGQGGTAGSGGEGGLGGAGGNSGTGGVDIDAGDASTDVVTDKVDDVAVEQEAEAVPTCIDGAVNGDETDVDCGGSCTKCQDEKRCLVSNDCLSDHCGAGSDGGLVCKPATCSDGIKNQAESDKDCGGSSVCPRCIDGKTCSADSDCVPDHHCDPQKKLCAECLNDDNCAPGILCAEAAGTCTIAGCTQQHACPGTETCCSGECANLNADSQHCGTCTTECSGATAYCMSGSCQAACSARPYFMVVFDVSGSMILCTNPPTTFPNQCPTGATPNSCSLVPSRINDAKCSLRKTVDTHTEADFGLVRFQQVTSGCGDGPNYACAPYVVDGIMPEKANGCTMNAACLTGSGSDAVGGQVLVGLPVSSSSHSELLKWTDDDCGGGTELLPAGPTPLNGALRDAARHLRANVSSLGPSCRAVNIIMITDGGESCDATEVQNRAKYSAADLFTNGLGDGSGRVVRVFPIGIGALTASEKAALDDIAKMGQCGVATGACADAVTAPVAATESELTQRLAEIVASAP